MKIKPITIHINGKPFKTFENRVSNYDLAIWAGMGPFSADVEEQLKNVHVELQEGLSVSISYA